MTLRPTGKRDGEMGEVGIGTRQEEVEDWRLKQRGEKRNGGNGRGRMSNATINYLLSERSRFRGRGRGENGHAARILAWAPDLRFEIRRPSWVRMRLPFATTMPAAPTRHPNPWRTCWEGIGAAGDEKGAAAMRFHRHRAPLTRF